MTSLVTIAIPCFNNERWIKAAVQSALAQTWKTKEIIVVDDGSTDRSREILRGFGNAIRLLETPNRGANHARNLLLHEARGDWIQYLDADDYLLPGKIAAQLAANPGDADVLYSPTATEEHGDVSPGFIDTTLDVYAQWLAWQLPQTGGCLWRVEALRGIGGWNEAMPCCQEHELYLRALRNGMRFAFVATAGAVYRIWSEETLCRRDPRLVIEVKTRLIDEMKQWLETSGRWSESHQRTAGRACFEMARTLAKDDLTGAARYAGERKCLGLFRLAGPAAPATYRLCHAVFGFTAAETFARFLR